jgi:hypothetical protein
MLKVIRVAALLGIGLPALMVAQYYPRRGTPKPGAYSTVAGSFHGKLKDLTSKDITIETGDDQLVSIHRSRKTKFLKGTLSIKASDIDLGTMVTVDAHEEPADLSLTALSVTVDTGKKNGEK